MTNPNRVWMCGACGRVGPTRMDVGDESCYLNAVEVWEGSIERRPDGRGVSATATSEPWEPNKNQKS